MVGSSAREEEKRYQETLTKALADFRARSPFNMAAKSGTSYRDGQFEIKFFNRRFYLSHPEGDIQEAGTPDEIGAPPPTWIKVILLHYLITASGVDLADQWITYRQLPGAFLFERRFESMATGRLRQAFGNDIEGFRRAGRALGGEPMDRTGDAAFIFMALPRVRMACILYLGDEEVLPSVNVLFDASVPHYLPTEDLSVVGSYLAGALARLKGS